MARTRLRLVALSQRNLTNLLAGRREPLEHALEVVLPPDWPQEGDLGFLRLALARRRHEPPARRWLVRLVVLTETRQVVGHAGFHGPPGVNCLNAPDAVELGYTVFPPFRGRGYATEAASILVDYARARGAKRVLASVSPENAASLAVVRKLGFRLRGRHHDELDGPELEFELDLGGGL